MFRQIDDTAAIEVEHVPPSPRYPHGWRWKVMICGLVVDEGSEKSEAKAEKAALETLSSWDNGHVN